MSLVAVRRSLVLPMPYRYDDLPGLVLLLDADRIEGVAAGGSIGTWSDLSGKAHSATQATAANKPTLQVAILNGRSVVRFDGVDDNLVITRHADLEWGTGDFSMCFVLKTNDADAWVYNKNNQFLYSGAAANYLQLYIAGSTGLYTNQVSDNAWHVITLVRRSGTVSPYYDGVALATFSAVGSVDATLDIYLGSNGAGGALLTGDVALILACNVALDAEAISRLHGRLRRMTGLLIA